MVEAGQTCANTPSCQSISSPDWCKSHADKLNVAYNTAEKPEISSTRPAGCYLELSSGALRYNSFKESVVANKLYQPLCLCGAYQDLGIGMCREDYYAGSIAPGATLQSCRAVCDTEDKCRFFSLESNTCKRYSGDINSCTPLDGETHRTYQKLKIPAGERQRRAALEVEHDYYAEYASVRGEDMALKKSELHELKMPAGSNQPCTSFGLHPNLPFLKSQYDAGDCAFIANAGGLTEPMSLQDYNQRPRVKKLPIGLFAHNVMQKHARTVHAEYKEAKGVLGRIMKELAQGSNAMKSGLYSVSGYTRMLDGALNVPPHIINSNAGVERFEDYKNLKADIENMTRYLFARETPPRRASQTPPPTHTHTHTYTHTHTHIHSS